VSTELPVNPESGKGRVVLWLLALGVPLLLLVAWWPAPPKPRPALPNPNGYDYFVKAGAAMSGVWSNRTLTTVPLADLQAYVAANQASLELAREGLKHHSLSHFQPVYHAASKVYHFGDSLLPLKRLGVLMSGEARIAELENQPEAAVEGYLTVMRFGQEASRGGMMIERLEVGISVEQRGLAELRRLLVSMEGTQARRSLTKLQELDDAHESTTVNVESQAYWVRQAFPIWRILMFELHPTWRSTFRKEHQSFANRVDALQAERRRAIVEAAARLFELEKGRRPTGYADLVPAYLKAVPLDPTTGKEITHPF